MAQYSTINQQGAFQRIRAHTVTNQATTAAGTFNDVIQVPQWAKYATFYLNVTVMTGTSPLIDFNLRYIHPTTLDTTHISDFTGWGGITQLTANTIPLTVVSVGPGITGIADDDTGAATGGGHYSLNAVLPPALLSTLTCDGTTADEDYTLTLDVHFRS